MSDERQTLLIDSPMGDQPVLAPGGWKYDKTAAIVWQRLLWLSQPGQKFTRQKDKFAHDAKREILGIILANSLGMAGPYWLNQAKEIANG